MFALRVDRILQEDIMLIDIKKIFILVWLKFSHYLNMQYKDFAESINQLILYLIGSEKDRTRLSMTITTVNIVTNRNNLAFLQFPIVQQVAIVVDMQYTIQIALLMDQAPILRRIVTIPLVNYLIIPFPSQDQIKGPQNNHHIKKKIYDRAKLYEIEQVLAPFCPRDFIQKVIAGLIQICRETGDYSIIDEAFEGHRKNVLNYYCKR